MNPKSNFIAPSMPPLPEPLQAALTQISGGLGKRERSRAQLIAAAIQVLAARGVAQATVQEVAEAAGMTTGTVYNHFETKDDLVQQVGLRLANTLCRCISESQQPITEGAERMAIGNRRYLWLAEQSPAWALLLVDVASASPVLLADVRRYALEDLRLGVRQKSFRIPSETAAMNLINGTVLAAMLSIAAGEAPKGHASAVAAMVLRGLGMAFEDAAAIARRPLPPLRPLAAVSLP